MSYLIGVQYAQDVVKGNIEVCNNIKLACQRFLNYMEDKHWEYEFFPEYVEHVLDFVGMLKHTKGPDTGQPIVLEPFQVLLLCGIYGFRYKKDHEKRMTTDVIVFIPRKAGKSTLTAVIGLYELAFNEGGAEVFTLATNREQASIVFDAARSMIESMPDEIKSWYRVSKYEIGKSNDSQTMFRALSRDNKKSGDGKNASCVIIDEAAQIVDRNSIEVIFSGMVARKNPLRIYITTASFSKDTKFYEDLKQIRSYPYIEFKFTNKDSFNFTPNSTIDAIRYSNFEYKNDPKFPHVYKNELEYRVINQNMKANIVGVAIPRFNLLNTNNYVIKILCDKFDKYGRLLGYIYNINTYIFFIVIAIKYLIYVVNICCSFVILLSKYLCKFAINSDAS